MNDTKILNPDSNKALSSDRSFDGLAEHFAKKVYGGLKGEIRLAVLKRDLQVWMAQRAAKPTDFRTIADDTSSVHSNLNRPLRVLDVGAGLAQISLWLATQGHEVTINDYSAEMLAKAHEQAHELISSASQSMGDILWHHCPYQDLGDKLTGRYDLILCHALLEWLGNPQELIQFLTPWLAYDGALSLCFYNPASFVYRNLIMGNFNLLNRSDFVADTKRSLTPNNPVSFVEVQQWLTDAGFDISSTTGLRVFHDYAPLKRGGHTNPEAVIEMELRYSTQEPYKWLGRYLHVMAVRG